MEKLNSQQNNQSSYPTVKNVRGKVDVSWGYEWWGASIGDVDIETLMEELNGKYIHMMICFLPSIVKCPECGKEHEETELWGKFCDSDCYAYHYGDKVRLSPTTARKEKC